MEDAAASFHLPLSSFFSPTLASTFNRWSEWVAAAVLGGVVLWRQDSKGSWAAMGSLANVVFSIALKRLVNQPRPFPPKRSDPGMPSSHAHIIFYTFTFLILSMVERLGTNQLTLVLSGLALSFSSYLAWLRVSEKYHTVAQVMVGGSLGASFTLVWMWVWTAAVHKAYESLLWVQALVILGATAFWILFYSVTRSKFSPNKPSQYI